MLQSLTLTSPSSQATSSSRFESSHVATEAIEELESGGVVAIAAPADLSKVDACAKAPVRVWCFERVAGTWLRLPTWLFAGLSANWFAVHVKAPVPLI